MQASSSLTCARRGWVNVDADTIECEACGANLRFVSSATWTPDEGELLFIVYEALLVGVLIKFCLIEKDISQND